MNCLRQVLTQVEGSGYAHDIQRLRILSNFGVIGGISPTELEKWFHSAFVDAEDCVMQTNVLGMGLFADGGVLASKPYAASANYINKMSDYCRGCRFDRTVLTGENACPFNFFYWDFLARHRDKLQLIGPMSFIDRQSRQNAAERIGNHPPKSGRLALVKEVRQQFRRSGFNGFNGWTLR